MPLFSRRQKQPPDTHSNIKVVGLSRIDTVSTIDSLATIDNQPGAGRTVGLLLTYLGSELEDAINQRAGRLRDGSNALVQLARVDTISTIDSDATIDDQPGAGRTVGRFLGSVGVKLENAMNKKAERAGLGPKAIADEICRICGHREILLNSFSHVHLPVAPGRKLNESETKMLQKLCRRLIQYGRSHVKSIQLIALGEIIELSIKDPRIRTILAECNPSHFITRYYEPDLLSATVKALGSIEFSDVHRVWVPVLTLFITPWRKFSGVYDLPKGSEEAILESLRDPSTSFLSARYFQRVVENANPNMALHPFLGKFGLHYAMVASQNPCCIEWSTFYVCGPFPSNTDRLRRGTMPVSLIFDMAANLDPEVFIRHLSSSLVDTFPAFVNNNFGVENFGDILPWLSSHGITEIRMLYNLLSSLTNSTDYWTHLSFIDRLSCEAKRSLKGSIFANKIIYTYCVLICHTITTSLIEENTLSDMCTPLLSFMKSDCIEEHSLATTLAVKFCTTNRYCKLVTLRTANRLSANDHTTISHNLTSANITKPFTSSVTPRALYRVSRLNFKAFDISTDSRPSRNGVVCVDKMNLDNDVAAFITVDGDEKPFCATGHYPISAFHSDEEPSTPCYIARVKYKRENYRTFYDAHAYTHVEDGASFVTYGREVYDDFDFQRLVTTTEERSSKFEVLVLRYDPVDYRSKLRDGELKDPTGPLGWRNVYTAPEMYFADCLDWFS
ncbi:hypothetical protein SCHPADRAFT_947058 [Schizopora paradoxa]|uniref:Uncharacterized protein n=1 Tax=Schizopora paradoxa TaxID=27342 RepID=A0A0H2R0L9_9AGAM|nr:hypothetical protein SCHPADRAFT_947058 [Schizopora paradoxa]